VPVIFPVQIIYRIVSYNILQVPFASSHFQALAFHPGLSLSLITVNHP